MPSRRLDRVSSLLKQAIGRIIVSEMSDPRMGFVTVVKVEISKDLRSADIYVSVMGEKGEISRTMHGLRHAASFIRHRVEQMIDIRSVPELRFKEDLSVKGTARVSKLIADALGDKAAGAQSASGEPAVADEPVVKVSNEELEKLLQEKKEEEEALEEGADEDDEDDEDEEEEEEEEDKKDVPEDDDEAEEDDEEKEDEEE